MAARMSRSPNRNLRIVERERRVMSVAAHIEELRRRVFLGAAVTIAVGIALVLRWRLLMQIVLLPVYAPTSFLALDSRFPYLRWDWTLPPIGTGGHQLLALSPVEPFFTVINVIAASSLILTSPLWFYQAWAFLAPVFDRERRRVVRQLAFMAIALFIVGASFAYLIVLPAALRFLTTFGAGVFDVQFRASYYLGFVSSFLLAVGGVFDVPPVLLTLLALGVVSARRLRRWRRVAVFAAGLIAAFVVPSQDPLSIGLVMVPIYLLYEVTIWIAPHFERRLRWSDADGR